MTIELKPINLDLDDPENHSFDDVHFLERESVRDAFKFFDVWNAQKRMCVQSSDWGDDSVPQDEFIYAIGASPIDYARRGFSAGNIDFARYCDTTDYLPDFTTGKFKKADQFVAVSQTSPLSREWTVVN